MEKKMKNIKLIGFLAVAIAAVLIIWTTFSQNSTAASAPAGWDCNVHNISGDYVVAGFGSVVDANNIFGFPVGPYNSAATSTLDGSGHYSITFTTFVGGALVLDGVTINGVYTVGPNCSAHFYDSTGTVELVHTYGTAGHVSVQGVSMVPGTNITYLITRK